MSTTSCETSYVPTATPSASSYRVPSSTPSPAILRSLCSTAVRATVCLSGQSCSDRSRTTSAEAPAGSVTALAVAARAVAARAVAARAVAARAVAARAVASFPESTVRPPDDSADAQDQLEPPDMALVIGRTWAGLLYASRPPPMTPWG